MEIPGSVALVTGANRGIGRHFAQQLKQRGAAKVYATARTPERVDLPGVEVLRVDVTDPDSIAAAAAVAGDVNLLVNNAGVSTAQNLVTGDLDKIRLEMETHFFGALGMVRAFAPILAANGGGAILNVLSALSWMPHDGAGAYSTAKAAEWSLTNAVRLELAGQGTQVSGLVVGAVDTDMMAAWDVPKKDPVDVVRSALDGIEAGLTEILADESAVLAKASLAGKQESLA
ncbi:short-subunit dehydrogenase [Amycolatopsis bartoniae]|uniref:Short-chain dehydrogenase n=1 Tax=Amycolatopsis bartoniae TaxID=941986 RepID=A0A8H9MBL9_9PSEU|nr:SDR family oxidoreductase [Amycolatopsis bartoniae]MBB2938973.1 short-subunit dehydrogenase [Amycolatopsis bartoniae]TVT11226.1 SDR family oxidoreductase [Amycolatopsis bartoniae]GHF65842.1 short-chain dehydrogenase [Amycolatopsis bartoniae]